MANDSIYTAALMEHNSHPDYKYLLEDFNYEGSAENSNCGDAVTLRVRLTEDSSTLEEVAFLGHGCAVSQASADILAELITGEPIEEAKRLSVLFGRMLAGEELEADEVEDLDEAYELQSLALSPTKVECAQLAWRIFDEMF